MNKIPPGGEGGSIASSMPIIVISGVLYHVEWMRSYHRIETPRLIKWYELIHERARFVASGLGLYCLYMSHKKDARLIWFNNSEKGMANHLNGIS